MIKQKMVFATGTSALLATAERVCDLVLLAIPLTLRDAD
jgi:hypothetical protein